MWLLSCNTLQLESFLDWHTPRYAILSHTWEEEEVFLQDMVRGTASQKRGFAKITSACQQALHDGFAYIWIDTCCIDKTSSAELSEAINSMFRYYAESSICYAYLVDVEDLYDGDESRMDTFARSRYWTRGWTLQELIAPSEMIFFDRSWKYINSRTDCAPQIARITGIDVALLSSQGRGELTEALASYSVAERLSWAANRQTTRLEDSAYSLFGLFGVNMPLLYGEGSAAFERLQQEILRATADLSILAWPRDAENGLMPLARSTRNFDFNSSQVVVKVDALPFASRSDDSEAAMFTRGLRVTAPIVAVPSKPGYQPGLAMLLGCRYRSDITTVLALKLTVSSNLSQGDVQDVMKQDRLECSVGWSSEPGQERLVQVDVLDAAELAQPRNIFIRRNRIEDGPNASAVLNRPRAWTMLWLRIDKVLADQDWQVLDMYPRGFWNRSKLTFDLSRAREDRIRTDETAAAGDQLSTFGLPIFGAIAITNKGGDRVAIYFTQRSPSLDDGIEFEVEPYKDQVSLLKHDFKRRTEPRQRVSAIQLKNSKPSLNLTIELRAVQISEHNVAVLAVSIASLPFEKKGHKESLHGMSRVRGPLNLLKKHREGS